MKKNRDSTSSKVWIWLIVPVVSLIISSVAGALQENYGVLSTVIAMLFIVIIVVLGLLFRKNLLNTLNEKYYNKKIQLGMISFAEELKKRLQNKEDIERDDIKKIGIMPEHELAMYEKNCNCDEIWIISNDLSTELGPYADIVCDNLKRGIKYKFFYQNTPQNQIHIAQIKRKNSYSENASYFCLNDDFFFIVTNLDFTIYDPYSSKRVGYIGLEFPGKDELYAIRVNDSMTDAIASNLLKYTKEG